MKNADGTCYCNPREDTYGYGGYCLYRPEGKYVQTYQTPTTKTCGTQENCVNAEQASRCLGTGFYARGGGCWYMASCTNTAESIGGNASTAEGCKACPNRCFNVVDNSCRLFGEDKDYLKNADGTCYCNPREDTYGYGGYCLYRPEGKYVQTYQTPTTKTCGTQENCVNAEQASRCLGTGFYARGGGCWYMASCTNAAESIGGNASTAEGCKACPNRCFNVVDNSCRLFGEGKDYLKNADGTCYCNPREDTYAYGGYCLYRPEGTFVQTYGTPSTRTCGQSGCIQSDQATRCLGTGVYVRDAGGCAGLTPCTNSKASLGGAEATGCKACPNRCFNTSDSTCRLIGDGQLYTKNAEGNCVAN